MAARIHLFTETNVNNNGRRKRANEWLQKKSEIKFRLDKNSARFPVSRHCIRRAQRTIAFSLGIWNGVEKQWITDESTRRRLGSAYQQRTN